MIGLRNKARPADAVLIKSFLPPLLVVWWLQPAKMITLPLVWGFACSRWQQQRQQQTDNCNDSEAVDNSNELWNILFVVTLLILIVTAAAATESLTSCSLQLFVSNRMRWVSKFFGKLPPEPSTSSPTISADQPVLNSLCCLEKGIAHFFLMVII